jgi:hypothetical protein
MDIQKLVTSGPFGYFRHPIYVGFIGSTVSLSFLLDCPYRWHCGFGCCMRWHCRIGSCMPFARACALAAACDSMLHALLVALSHSCVHVLVVHLGVRSLFAFALACPCRASHCRIRSCIHQYFYRKHACVCVCCCVCAYVFGRRVRPQALVSSCLTPPTCVSCTHIHTCTHAHTHSLVGVGTSSGYIVGHVMPVEEEWVRPTL